jgi:hypothetical protein
LFQGWKKNSAKIKNTDGHKKRAVGGGRKPVLGDFEGDIVTEILNLRLMKYKVTRQFIADRAMIIAEASNFTTFKASGRWVSEFMERHGLSLRRATNLTTLTDDVLLNRAVDFMAYLQSRLQSIDRHHTVLMDETAVYFEDARTQTVDFKGRHHVVIKSTGFASMRITVLVSVWADGRKAAPLLIQKGKYTGLNWDDSGAVITARQEKAWVNENVIIKWIDAMFPLGFTVSGRKCIVFDSCKAHVSLKVKDHCRRRHIDMIVIPGGLTPYLQAGDIGIFRELKDIISSKIDAWKKSDTVEKTRYGNPKPPSESVVKDWIHSSWNEVSRDNVKRSIASAGFDEDFKKWHISKHDLYGAAFREKWMSQPNYVPVDPDILEEIPQDDDIDEVEVVEEENFIESP